LNKECGSAPGKFASVLNRLIVRIPEVNVYSHFFTLHPTVESQLCEQFVDGFYDFSDMAEEEPEPEHRDHNKIVELYEHRSESLEKNTESFFCA